MKEMISCCGLKCHECDAYIATQAGDAKRIEELARQYSSEGQTYSPDDLWCDGCTQTDGRLFSWCSECPIRACCLERHLPNCAHCGEFPCGIIEKCPDEGVGERLAALKSGGE